MDFLGSRRRVALAFGFILALTGAVNAQSPYIISGRIVDASGGVVVGAGIKVTGAAGTSRDAVSDARGEFSIAGLPAGDFVVHVEWSQFAPATISVRLSEDAPHADVRVVLAPAAFSENLTVAARRTRNLYRPSAARCQWHDATCRTRSQY